MVVACSVPRRAGGRSPRTSLFPAVIRPGLERVRHALDLLGHPEESFAAVLVGGTNGKGSVSAMIESGLRRAGVRTGLYTSPHLIHVRERTRIVGNPVTTSVWRRATARVAQVAGIHRLRLTEFEAQTLAAFLVFEGAGVELAVLEVGLGGRLDAVNAVAAPELSVITSIGLDHTDWLGPTLRHIYLEKRGIARTGTMLLQDLPPSLHAAARRFAVESGVPSWTLGQEIRFESIAIGKKRFSSGVAPTRHFLLARLEDRGGGGLGVRCLPGKHPPSRPSPSRGEGGVCFGQRICVRVPTGVYSNGRVPFWGAHQARNAALAVAALHVLRGRGWRISESAIESGVAQARWPGRFDVVGLNPPVVLDGAHNPAAANALAKAWKSAPWGRQRATLIFSCLKDKDVQGIVAALSPVVRRVIVIPLKSDRACPVEDLGAVWRGRCPTETAANFQDAWKKATMDKHSPILVAGSLYLVGEAMAYLRRPG